MDAGPELDAEIARRVFGRSIRTFEDIYGHTTRDDALVYRQNVGRVGQTHWTLVPPYSADIGAAWSVVEHLEAQGWYIDIAREDDGWWTRLRRGTEWHRRPGDTAAESICWTALALDAQPV